MFSIEQGKPLHPDVGVVDQRLALHILRQQNLVPEHIEKRTLYNPMQPSISQVQYNKVHVLCNIIMFCIGFTPHVGGYISQNYYSTSTY